MIGAILSNPDVAENKIVEVVAETTAPLVDLREQLAALPVTGLTQAERLEKQRREEEEAERKEQERREAGERDGMIAPLNCGNPLSTFVVIVGVEFHLSISSELTLQCCWNAGAQATITSADDDSEALGQSWKMDVGKEHVIRWGMLRICILLPL